MKTTNEKDGAHVYEKPLLMLTYQLGAQGGHLWRGPDEVMNTIITPEAIQYRMIKLMLKTRIGRIGKHRKIVARNWVEMARPAQPRVTTRTGWHKFTMNKRSRCAKPVKRKARAKEPVHHSGIDIGFGGIGVLAHDEGFDSSDRGSRSSSCNSSASVCFPLTKVMGYRARGTTSELSGDSSDDLEMLD